MSDEETPRERLESLLKTPYDSESEAWQALLIAFANEYEEFEQTVAEVQKQKFVETATGEPLNKIADLFGLNRRQDETVDAFRVRVKTALRSQITTVTVAEVRDIVALLLATDIKSVNVEEPFDHAQAQILLDVLDDLATVDITSPQFIDVVDAAVAAGVGVGILLTEDFEDTIAIDDATRVQTDVVKRQRESRTDAAFLVEEVPWEDASRYGVCDTNDYGEIVEVVEKPDDPPSNLVMTGFYTFSPAIFHAAKLVQPSDRGEYEISDAIDLLLQSGRTIDAIRLDGWRIDVGYPEDRDEAERRLQEGKDAEADAETVSTC